MRAKATLYTRTNAVYSQIQFKKGKALVPRNYDGTFYIRVTEDGKRKWLPFASVDAALSQRQKLTDNLEAGLRPTTGLTATSAPTVAASPKGNLTIVDAANTFLAECESRIQGWRNGDENGLSPATITAYRRAIKNFVTSCSEFGATHVSEFLDAGRGVAILKNHKVWLQDHTQRRTGKAAYSDSRQFVVLNQFLAGHGIKMAKDKTVNPNDVGLLKRVDVPRVRKPAKGDVVYYTPADLKAMLSACATVGYKKNNNVSFYDAHDLRDLVLILFWTGVRDEELQHLEWTDVNGKILIQDKPHWDWRVKDHEKRPIKITPQLKALLDARAKRMTTAAWQKNHGGHSKTLIFSTSLSTPDQNFADRIGGLQERAVLGEVERKNPTEKNRKPYEFSRPECRRHILHNFRKTWATWQSVKGVPAQNIQHALGHSELSTTERYLALVDDPDAVRAGFEAIG